LKFSSVFILFDLHFHGIVNDFINIFILILLSGHMHPHYGKVLITLDGRGYKDFCNKM